MKLLRQLPIVVLKGCPYVGASLYCLCVFSGFGGRAGFDVNTSHVFAQGVPAAMALVGGGTGDGRVEPGVRPVLPSAQ